MIFLLFLICNINILQDCHRLVIFKVLFYNWNNITKALVFFLIINFIINKDNYL
jgi:hypothetical protein